MLILLFSSPQDVQVINCSYKAPAPCDDSKDGDRMMTSPLANHHADVAGRKEAPATAAAGNHQSKENLFNYFKATNFTLAYPGVSCCLGYLGETQMFLKLPKSLVPFVNFVIRSFKL